MNNQDSKLLKDDLTSFVHDLFTGSDYLCWRRQLEAYQPGKWYSLIVKLDEQRAPLQKVREFGQDIYSKLVFSWVMAPDYVDSKELMVLFTVSGSLWHSVIWYRPEPS